MLFSAGVDKRNGQPLFVPPPPSLVHNIMSRGREKILLLSPFLFLFIHNPKWLPPPPALIDFGMIYFPATLDDFSPEDQGESRGGSRNICPWDSMPGGEVGALADVRDPLLDAGIAFVSSLHVGPSAVGRLRVGGAKVGVLEGKGEVTPHQSWS